MAANVTEEKDSTGSLSEESTGLAFGELIRDFEPEPEARWRNGKPNYAKVNKTYFDLRAIEHEESSLESIMGKLIKNWEVESRHVTDMQKWKTVDVTKFKAALNGGRTCSADKLADIGLHNSFLWDTKVYSNSSTSSSSRDIIIESPFWFTLDPQVYASAFPDGFAWECLEVFSGPPSVLFKWRQFGKYTGTFTDKAGRKLKGNGTVFSLIGICVARVNSDFKLEGIDVYYNPEELLAGLSALVDSSWRPLGEEAGESFALQSGCNNTKGSCTTM
mmetsp:Transcript_89680/g.159319  ORF Transcript_89680/g.159319 Transcript_89680/m.159319 type:complete len:275 (-) Transcript_89680:110-934(-)|eukprot:CAMPEP_0197634048 /NCGR_PEP_ID=MMETSP1338-20131121/10261_1 /TAXON_ID=43686 ORGANISM="Pelagodinium beii, Strain RCC1491" /NCGR_SAMPLE_ID=MMETSP1338 /ASSEMBLY_ACC=CAM_ASM_000754 /LENGTH=274 /DNA_ID=CAMNT_0043205841 /DNA_START=42 /DNA_END=866 /DNA_ORIENTATION=-